MARVNVEERFFAEEPRIKRVAKLLGWHPQRVKGCILDLWFYSQEALEFRGSAEDIAFWAQIDDPAEAAKVVEALSDKRSGFIKKAGEDLFEIAGNREQITSRVKNSDKRIKGGRATHEKWKRLMNQTDDARLNSPVKAGSEQAPDQANSGQGRAGQFRAGQGNSGESETPPALQELKDCVRAWKETLEHFKFNRGISPTEETQIARAGQRHGYETVELALFGARYEKPITEKGWNPGDHLSLSRILEKDREGKERIHKFANLGAKAKDELARKRVNSKGKEPTEEERVLSAEEIRALLAEAGFSKRDSELPAGVSA